MTQEQRQQLLDACFTTWEQRHSNTEESAMHQLQPMITMEVAMDLGNIIDFTEEEICTELFERGYKTMSRPDGSLTWAVYTNINDEEE